MILGQGNVALDVARILLTPVSMLEVITDSVGNSLELTEISSATVAGQVR